MTLLRPQYFLHLFEGNICVLKSSCAKSTRFRSTLFLKTILGLMNTSCLLVCTKYSNLRTFSFLKPGLHVTFASAFSFDLFRHILENANVKCKHDHLLPQNPLLTFDANADADVTCKQGLNLFQYLDLMPGCITDVFRITYSARLFAINLSRFVTD